MWNNVVSTANTMISEMIAETTAMMSDHPALSMAVLTGLSVLSILLGFDAMRDASRLAKRRTAPVRPMQLRR